MTTIAERRKMKQMGYTIKVNYERPNKMRFPDAVLTRLYVNVIVE